MGCRRGASEVDSVVGDTSFFCDAELKSVLTSLVSGFPSDLGMLRSERSTGLAISSKLELSPSFASSESAPSLSANLDAKLEIELVCSFTEGGGARNAGCSCETSLSGSASDIVAA